MHKLSLILLLYAASCRDKGDKGDDTSESPPPDDSGDTDTDPCPCQAPPRCTEP